MALEPENVELQDSFWFNREEDEAFKGNLTNRRIAETNRASKAYAEFLATSTRLSLVSFTPHQSVMVSKRLTADQLDPTYIANEMLPDIPEPPTWRQWIAGRKILILATVMAMFGVLLLSFFTVPVTELNNDQAVCTIFESEAVRIACPGDAGEGYCIQHTVAVPQGDGLFDIGVLQGFEVQTDIDSGNQVNCAVTNCTSDPFTDLGLDEENLGEICLVSLEELNLTVDDLDDVALLTCSFLAQEEECVRLLDSDSVFKKTYFDVAFDSGAAVSVPKQPDNETVIIVTAAFFGTLFILIIAAVFELRKPVVKPVAQDQPKDEVNATLAVQNDT